MTDLFSAFATDDTVEQDGVKTQLPNAGDTLFTIARMPNKHYSKLIQKQVKMNRAVLDSKGDAAEKCLTAFLLMLWLRRSCLAGMARFLTKARSIPTAKRLQKCCWLTATFETLFPKLLLIWKHLNSSRTKKTKKTEGRSPVVLSVGTTTKGTAGDARGNRDSPLGLKKSPRTSRRLGVPSTNLA